MYYKHFRIPMLKKNLSRPSGKRHSLSRSVDHVLFDTIDHVPVNIPVSSFPNQASHV